MGQRTQTFLITPNVFKKVEHWLFRGDEAKMKAARNKIVSTDLGDLPTFRMKEGQSEEIVKVGFQTMAEAFGDELTTVISHHHQSLCGGEAVHLVYQVLEFCRNVTTVYNPFSLEHWQMKIVDLRTIPRFIDFIYGLLTVKHNHELARKIDSRSGFYHADFLNLKNRQIRHYFDRFQNDDGIFIIDTMECKYCFIDISTVENYTPTDAVTYYHRYYPTDENKLKDYYFKNYTESEIQAFLLKNRERLGIVTDMFKDYEVMTREDVARYFPQMYPRLGYKKPPALLVKPTLNFLDRFAGI